MKRAPDYIIIGAMKCGTSTLAAQLGAQDGIFVTEPKEPQYFSDDPIYRKGPDWYASLFAEAAPGDLIGEASTHYTKLPTYPETVSRMKAACPHLRLVYMIRNPMTRIISHYIHGWSMGEISCSFEEALETVPELVEYGLYGKQIAPFVEAYGQEAILLTSLELLKQDPGGELARVAQHIGHDAPVAWIEDKGQQNASSERVRRLPMQALLINNPIATALRRTFVPKSFHNWIRSRRQMKTRPEIPADAIPKLQKRFTQDHAALAEVFPDDPSVRLAYPFITSS